MDVTVINLAIRHQGIIVPHGNPMNIQGIDDFTRVRFINRQRGAGTRILLDWKLKQAGLKPSDVKGYDKEEFTHMAVAVNVLTGAADCGMGIYAAAKALGLDFVPLALERYDLVIPARFLDDPVFRPSAPCSIRRHSRRASKPRAAMTRPSPGRSWRKAKNGCRKRDRGCVAADVRKG